MSARQKKGGAAGVDVAFWGMEHRTTQVDGFLRRFLCSSEGG